MAKLTATFKNNQQISRNSKMNYAYAYAVTVCNGTMIVRDGFASSLEAAQKAAQKDVANILNNKLCTFIDGVAVEMAPLGVEWETVPVVAE